MKILKEKTIEGHRHIYYTADRDNMRGYVFHMSSISKLTPDTMVFRGWVCSIPVWERTYKNYIGA